MAEAIARTRRRIGSCKYCFRFRRLRRVDKTQLVPGGPEYGWSVWICRRCYDRHEQPRTSNG